MTMPIQTTGVLFVVAAIFGLGAIAVAESPRRVDPLDRPCIRLSANLKLPNGWPAHCARITGGGYSEFCTSLEGHPSHSRVGLAVRFVFDSPPTTPVPFAYEPDWVEEEMKGSQPALYVDVLTPDEIQRVGSSARWQSARTAWARPAIGRHLFRFAGADVVLNVDRLPLPEAGCQTEVELPVPPAAVSAPAYGPGSPANVGGLWDVTLYTDSSLLAQIPDPPSAAFGRRTVVYLAAKEGYQTAETAGAGLPLWQFLVPGSSTDRPFVATHLLPYMRVISARTVFVSVAGAYCGLSAVEPQYRGTAAEVFEVGIPNYGPVRVPSLGINTGCHHILRPDGVACRSASLCDYNEACPHKITTQCDAKVATDGCGAGPAGAQAWGLALVAGAWAWRRRRRRSAIDR